MALYGPAPSFCQIREIPCSDWVFRYFCKRFDFLRKKISTFFNEPLTFLPLSHLHKKRVIRRSLFRSFGQLHHGHSYSLAVRACLLWSASTRCSYCLHELSARVRRRSHRLLTPLALDADPDQPRRHAACAAHLQQRDFLAKHKVTGDNRRSRNRITEKI
jgi:hypothetical protein